jgi:hypothetical protein
VRRRVELRQSRPDNRQSEFVRRQTNSGGRVYDVEFEGTELYLHREDAEQGLDKNGVWIDLNRAEIRKYRALNLKYVIIEGIFYSKQWA